jgi:hypothetical protein
MNRLLTILLLAAGTAYGQIDNPPTSANIVDSTATGRAVLTATNAAAAATALSLGTTNDVTFNRVATTASGSFTNPAIRIGASNTGLVSVVGFLYGVSKGESVFAAGPTGFSVVPPATFSTNVNVNGSLVGTGPATFSTNVTVNGSLSVGSFTTTTPSTWALDATQTAAATNGRLTLPSNANVIRLTNNNAISSVTNGVLGAFYYLVNQATNAVTISNVGGITIDGAQNLTLSPNESATLIATGPTNVSVANRGDLTDVALGGTANTAPSQTASSGSSLMTRDLGDARYLPKFGQFLNGNFYYQTAADWMPTKATNGGTASFVATGSRWTVNLATNASSASGVRLGRLDRGYNDSALLAWSSTFTAFVYAEIWARTNAICRFVVTQTGTTEGIANYPTNRAVGIEFRGAANMEARLIAHNGTTATNGPWVSFNYGSIVYAYNTLFAVRHLTNGTVELYRNSTNVPSATITGGPTNGSSAGFVHVDYGMENSTNAADNSANMQNSVEWWGVEYD